MVEGVGEVYAGTVVSGTVSVGDRLLLGPTGPDGTFLRTAVASVHVARLAVRRASAGQTASFTLVADPLTPDPVIDSDPVSSLVGAELVSSEVNPAPMPTPGSHGPVTSVTSSEPAPPLFGPDAVSCGASPRLSGTCVDNGGSDGSDCERAADVERGDVVAVPVGGTAVLATREVENRAGEPRIKAAVAPIATENAASSNNKSTSVTVSPPPEAVAAVKPAAAMEAAASPPTAKNDPGDSTSGQGQAERRGHHVVENRTSAYNTSTLEESERTPADGLVPTTSSPVSPVVPELIMPSSPELGGVGGGEATGGASPLVLDGSGGESPGVRARKGMVLIEVRTLRWGIFFFCDHCRREEH